MVLDAFRAEALKLRLNVVVAGLAFVLTPAATLLFGVVLELLTLGPAGGLALYPRPIDSAMDGLAAGGNLLVELLFIIGAAFLFAGEYRWETWRAILPRTDRTALVCAKMLVFVAFAAASLLACGVAGFAAGAFAAVITRLPPIWPDVGVEVVARAAVVGFLASMLQALCAAALAAVTAVVSRSLLAAVVAPIVTLTGLEILASRVDLADASVELLLPSVAGRALRELASGLLGDPDALATPLATPGAAALSIWGLTAFGAAVWLFHRQDLARE